MDERIKKAAGHYVICGFGEIGAAICSDLHRMSIPFVVAEKEDAPFERATALGFPVVKGDATADATLVSAGIRRASGLVICAGDSTTNLIAAMAGRELNPSLHIIARSADPAMEERLIRAGADSVVYPLKLGGQRIARLIVEQSGRIPEADTGTEEPGVFGYKVKLYRRFGTGGQTATVAEIVGRTGAVEAVSLKRADGSEIERPGPDEMLCDGDALALLVRAGRAPKVMVDVPPEWTEEMSVGIASIDEEHRMLFALIGQVGAAAKEKTPRAEIAGVLDRLLEYTEGHFRHEEELFRKFGYPGAEVHAATHRDLTAQVLELNRDRASILSENIYDFLVDWLKSHILGSDKEYVSFFLDKGVK